MDIGLYLAGIVIAVVSLVVLLVGTIWIYLVYCSKHPMRKLKAEILVVALVFVISLGIRLGIGFAYVPHSEMTGGAESVLHGILTTVAGLTFDSPTELSNFSMVNGIAVCFYYGLIAYAGFVFLSVVTVGVSYDFYSRIQTLRLRHRKHCRFYIFTAITNDSLVLAEDIKKHEKGKNRPYVIIFFENSDAPFSRKNPMHRRIMQNGFYYFSDPRCNDDGETVCFLKRFKFKRKHCVKNDVGENHNRLFYVFALGNSGDYEGNNADVVFDDLRATVKDYVHEKNGISYNGIPTVLNYYVLTSGEVNYESYERRTKETISEQIKDLSETFDWNGDQGFVPQKNDDKQQQSSNGKKQQVDDDKTKKDKGKRPESLLKYIDSQTQVNVISEATLCAHGLVLARKKHLDKLGDKAFEFDSAPDEHGAYRIAVIGFGQTGQCAMEELYTHTAHIVESENGYVPTQFIADIFDDDIDKKAGLFAYNHPLFRCLDEKNKLITDTPYVMKRAKQISGEGIEVLRSECLEALRSRCDDKTKVSEADAIKFIDDKMAFPVAVMHKGNCFGYPYLAKEGTETAIDAVRKYHIRDIVVALGSDERNIDMTNMLIDSFRRMFLKEELSNKKTDMPHIKIYVNIIDKNNRAFIDWRADKDKELFMKPYECDAAGKISEHPRLSVIPFGARENMYSYSAFIEDYRERLYNYAYNLISTIKDEKDAKKKSQYQETYDIFKLDLKKEYNAHKNNEQAIDQWMTISQFLRLSNRSAMDFAINYFKYYKCKQSIFDQLTSKDKEYLKRLEHERWNRFFIAQGWVYAKYHKDEKYKSMSEEEQNKEKKKEKLSRREVRQHNCLCPYDEMLEDTTKDYDQGNVELGCIKRIVYGSSAEE